MRKVFDKDLIPLQQILALSITGIGIVFTIIFHVGVEEKPIILEHKSVMTDSGSFSVKPTLKVQWLGWFYNWHFYRVFINKEKSIAGIHFVC